MVGGEIMRAGGGLALRSLALVLGTACLAGCDGRAAPPLTDAELIVSAVLRLQVADGRPVCVDRRTASDPLVIWRTMRVAPRPSRALVGWSYPRPLRSLNAIDARQLIDDQLRGRRVVLREPEAPPRLPVPQQRTYEFAAERLSLEVDRSSVNIRDGWGGASVAARWWPLNRIARSCGSRYEFSDPVWRNGVGFLTVKSDHWGTTYALRKGPRGWIVSAQWTPWLY